MGKGASRATQQAQMDLQRRQQALAEREEQRSEELRGIVLPGLKTAENYYSKIAGGDPMEIFRAIAPAADQVGTAAQSAKNNIQATGVRGGEKNLAKEMVDANTASQVGQLATKSYAQSPAALAQLAGQGLGLSVNEIANAISSNAGAGTTLGNVGQQQAAGKASTMGFLGSLAGAGGSMGAAAIAACWIAEALYGEYDGRTKLLRYWLNNVWGKRSVIGFVTMALYRRYGRQVAARVHTSKRLERIMRPIFDRALRHAQLELSFTRTIVWGR